MKSWDGKACLGSAISSTRGICERERPAVLRNSKSPLTGVCDFDANRHFLVDHIERVIYDRYDVSAVGAILVAAPAAIAHAGALDGSSRCRVTPAPESRSARCALLQIASNMSETDK